MQRTPNRLRSARSPRSCPTWRALAAGVALLAAACGGDGLDGNRCVERGVDPASLRVAWESLENPILSYENVAVKDATLRWAEGRWHLFASYISETPFRFRVGHVTSTDLASWSEPELWDEPAAGGLASPDLTRAGDRYVVAYNTHTRDAEGLPKLYARTSPDLATWSEPLRLAPELHASPAARLIDAALAHTPTRTHLGFKLHQRFAMASRDATVVAAPFETTGFPATGFLENVQFLPIDGTWHLLGTGSPHRPRLFELRGDPEEAASWTRWRHVRDLVPPMEAWNGGASTDGSFERANAAYLCDARHVDGFAYLLYAGSNELERFGGRGHAKLGIARSRDLVSWETP